MSREWWAGDVFRSRSEASAMPAPMFSSTAWRRCSGTGRGGSTAQPASGRAARRVPPGHAQQACRTSGVSCGAARAHHPSGAAVLFISGARALLSRSRESAGLNTSKHCVVMVMACHREGSSTTISSLPFLAFFLGCVQRAFHRAAPKTTPVTLILICSLALSVPPPSLHYPLPLLPTRSREGTGNTDEGCENES